MQFDPDVIIRLLARGFVETLHAVEAGGIVRQDDDMPASMRLALYRLSGLALTQGDRDLGASIHLVHGLASTPMRDWGLAAFRPPFEHANAVLLDRDLGQPTDDCLLLAISADEQEMQENLIASRMRTAIARLPARQRDDAYRDVRAFTVRNPCLSTDDLSKLFQKHSELYVEISSLYAPLPHAALHGRCLRLCASCHSPLWPHHDGQSYPHGYCRLAHCRLRRHSMQLGEEITVEDPNRHRLAVNPVLSYWTGPGLFEIELFDQLLQTRQDVVLYPLEDAADIGVDGFQVGIDVKSYSSATSLGRRFSLPLKRFATFRKRIVAVPDERLRQDPAYCETAQSLADPRHHLRFMPISAVIREFAS